MAQDQHAQVEVPMSLESALDLLRSHDNCELLPPSGVPIIDSEMRLPPEIECFYRLCGGARIGIFEDDYYSWRIVSPSEFVEALPLVLGLSYECEKTFWDRHWARCFYRFAENQTGDERVLVSCGDKHNGLFFDGHQESFGCDNMRLIARTLPELLLALADAPMGRLPRPPHPSQQIFLSQL